MRKENKGPGVVSETTPGPFVSSIHLDPTPEDAYKRFRGGTFTHDSNELIWSGGRVQSGFDKPAVFFFQVDLPDYSTEMPASARTATGYKFTLRMFPGS